MMRGFGSPNSTARTIAGITRRSNTRCCVLAKSCGISVAESRTRQVRRQGRAARRRFDRFKTEKGYARARMISGLTLLQADENEREPLVLYFDGRGNAAHRGEAFEGCAANFSGACASTR